MIARPAQPALAIQNDMVKHARRSAEGKSDRDIRRCLKRYIARRLFRLLEAMPMTA